MITKEQFEYLQQFDDAFETATKSDYIKQSIKSGDVIKLRALYSDLIGYAYKMTNSCGKCVLNLMKRLSKYYFEYKNEGEKTRKTSSEEGKQDGAGSNDAEEIHSPSSEKGREQSEHRGRGSKKVGS